MSPCLLAGRGGFLEQEGAVLGSVPHLCARRCCLPWAEVLCLTCAWPLVLALQHWGQRWGQPHPARQQARTAGLCCVMPATVHSPACPFPCSATQESQGCISAGTSSFLHGRAAGHTEESLGWGRVRSALCCRSLHPFIPVARHPAVSFPGLAASCERSESVLAESFIHQCFSGAALVT